MIITLINFDDKIIDLSKLNYLLPFGLSDS